MLILHLSSTVAGFSQNKLWDKTIGGIGTDDLSIVQQTSDGGYILGGTSSSGKSGNKTGVSRGFTDFWIVKLKPDGSKEWDKTIGGDSSDELVSVQQTNDGGYILGGSSDSGKSGDKSQSNKGYTDYWIVKLKADGTKDWDKTIGSEGSDHLASVQQTKDGGYILGGTSESGKSGDKSQANKGSNDYWIVKLKADGSKEWDKTYGGKENDELTALQQTRDGGYILGGTSWSEISGDKTEASRGGFDYWVVKLNANGKKEWDKTLGGSKYDQLSSLQQTSDGGYILGGNSYSGISGDKSEGKKSKNTEGYETDYWIVKLNVNGTKVWDKTIGGDSYDTFVSVQQTSDGGYILSGHSVSDIGDDKTQASKGGYDYWVVKLKTDGTKVWDKIIGGDSYDTSVSVQQTSDGSYILAGSSDSGKSGDKTEASKGGTDYWVVKLDNSGTNLNQIISFTPILYKTLGDAPFSIMASASSGLPVSFKVVSGPAAIKGNIVTLTGVGTVTVKASQAGNANYLPAEATRTFVVEAPLKVKKEWDKTIGGDSSDELVSVQQTNDGGYILGGRSHSSISGDKTEDGDIYGTFWVVKLKADGSKEWDKTYRDFDANGPEHFATVQQTKDGGYVIGRSKRDPKEYCDYEEGFSCIFDYWIIKLNPDGTIAWDKTYKADGNSKLNSLQQTQDGGYILGGNSNSKQSGDKSENSRDDCLGSASCFYYDYWIIKVDANGKKEWDKTYGGSNNDELVSIQQTRDGGYILGGSSASGISGDKTEASKDSKCESYFCPMDLWLVKLRADGTKEWDKTIGSVGDEKLTALQQTHDGGYVVGISGDDYRIVKLNALGNKGWNKTFGGNGNDNLRSILLTKDGGYLLGGSSDSSPGGDKSAPSRGSADFWLVKLKANGDKEWDKIFGGDKSDNLVVLQNTKDGGYILGGSSNSSIYGDKSEGNKGWCEEGSSCSVDYWIIKLKEDQPVMAKWNLRFGGNATDNLTSVIKTQDGGYLSGGYTNSGVSGDKSQNSQGKNDYWIVKSDQNGKKLWNKNYGGSSDDYLNSIVPTSDGGYLLAGSSTSNVSGDKSQQSRGERDYWVVKVDALGNIQWDKRFGGTGTEELKQVLVLPSGSFILAGTSNSPVSGDISQPSYGGKDYWVIKISRSGKKIWDQRYGGAQDDNLEALVFTPDGGFLVGGSSASGSSGTKTQVSQGSSDYWVVRITGEGKPIWDQRYGGSGEDYLMALGSTGTSTGNFFLAGTSTSGKSVGSPGTELEFAL